jgi:hypothetical protein
MTYILTRKSVGLSARLLSKELGLKRLMEPTRNPPLIRWGNSDVNGRPGEISTDTNLNNPAAIHICANKLTFSREMTKLGISHIQINTGNPTKFPVVVRQLLSASKGAGIVVCKNLQEYQNTPRNTYWSDWIYFSAEFGVHMLGGNIAKAMRKVREENEEKEEYPIRNSGRGYSFRRSSTENKGKLVEFMKFVYEKFPLQFGRWDIGWDNANKRYVVIEANSAPDLTQNEETAAMYVNFLRERIGK